MSIAIRFAEPRDAGTLHRFIVALAEYEREPDAVEVSAAELAEQMSVERPPFECLLAESDGTPVGIAVFFTNYSTWRGRSGLHLEDLYITPEHRGRGIGARLLAELARLAVDRGCARIDWFVLDWNEAAAGFYRRLGGRRLAGWNVYRLTNEPLAALAHSTTEKS